MERENAPEIQFNPLIKEDIPLLYNGLKRPHLRKWWREEVFDLKELKEKYLPRILGKNDASPFLIEIEGKAVGYIQYYSVNDGNLDWWPKKPLPHSYGIDLFLAKQEQLGQGIGRSALISFITFLKKQFKVHEI